MAGPPIVPLIRIIGIATDLHITAEGIEIDTATMMIGQDSFRNCSD